MGFGHLFEMILSSVSQFIAIFQGNKDVLCSFTKVLKEIVAGVIFFFKTSFKRVAVLELFFVKCALRKCNW